MTALPSAALTYEVADERFARFGGDARAYKLHEDNRWAEGPVYVPAGRYLLWSDIPNDRMLRWDETTGVVGVFRSPAGHTNGHTLDRSGRLISCEQGNRRLTRTEHDGTVTVLADRHEGNRFNSPNDVVVAADGGIWFTDPDYGIMNDYEGFRAESETDGCHVYRVNPATGDVQRVADDFVKPNGLAFSLDESRLYIADTRANHIREFTVGPGGKLSGGEVFAMCETGRFDGFRLDTAGRLWAAAGDGVHCFAPDGKLIGKIKLPEEAANLTFGGPKRNLMFVCATTTVYAFMTAATGVS
ncbi:SMP-30/gluconolactonase/LRE family protein [Amycolatopsis sp. H20-H5]|uniref:SMP-30/gluconolactonase/LRE family protein n=1 Tax=Amycolatopsis sp. H20-H5 TaxID=3046309 RepID=UPI002DB58488|nr:SMP-30/gluconolactonase/LRE family protein [Amycolatopsis sp. H20-H5]MEC3976176.1 SMP-30/gluconolactonase/LRE family protein [Amycolatopsis sp. H20-H5]